MNCKKSLRLNQLENIGYCSFITDLNITNKCLIQRKKNSIGLSGKVWAAAISRESILQGVAKRCHVRFWRYIDVTAVVLFSSPDDQVAHSETEIKLNEFHK